MGTGKEMPVRLCLCGGLGGVAGWERIGLGFEEEFNNIYTRRG